MPTFPSESWPADAVIEALDGTVDSGTGLPYVAKGVGPNSSPTYEVQYNRRLLRQNQTLASARQGMVVDEGPLNVGVYPLEYSLNGARKSFAGATNQAVPDDATRKVYVDASNALQVQTAYPTDLTSFVPLATVTAAAGTVTIVDDRSQVLYGVSPVDPSAKTFPVAPSVYLSGTLSVKVWEIEWVAPLDFTLRHANGRVNTAPVGAALIVDVRVNGASVFASQAEMINVADGQQQDQSATKNHAVTAGDVLTFEVEQVGSTTAGADLTITISGLAAMDSV